MSLAPLSPKEILQKALLFRGLDDRILAALAEVSQTQRFSKGSVVFLKGDGGDALFGVLTGRVRITTSNAEGREIFLNIMDAGEIFGEIALLDRHPRSADATTSEDSVLFFIERDEFLAVMANEPILAAHLLEVLCARVRWASERIEDSAFLSAPGRIAKRLLSLASLHGREVTGGMELGLSQSELGQFLGISRQVVNQYLQDWRREGWIELGRGKVTILDPGAMRKILAADPGSH